MDLPQEWEMETIHKWNGTNLDGHLLKQYLLKNLESLFFDNHQSITEKQKM